LPNINDKIETKFNRIFGNAVNSEMMGNCLRWVACKKMWKLWLRI